MARKVSTHLMFEGVAEEAKFRSANSDHPHPYPQR
jgi:hypothetical protein